jgi:hypothetical protein
MGARQKLNGTYFTGSLLVAGMIGAAGASWLAFGVCLTKGLCMRTHRQEIARLERWINRLFAKPLAWALFTTWLLVCLGWTALALGVTALWRRPAQEQEA